MLSMNSLDVMVA